MKLYVCKDNNVFSGKIVLIYIVTLNKFLNDRRASYENIK